LTTLLPLCLLRYRGGNTTTLLSVVVLANMTTMVLPVGALEARVELMPNRKVLVMVCVSKRDDCGRHLCLVLSGGRTKQRYCSVVPVWCWRCEQRSGGLPDLNLVKVSEVESRTSTLPASVQTLFGLELYYPASWTTEEFEAEGAGLWLFDGVSSEDVVGTVEVVTPMAVRQLTLGEVVALSDDGLGPAPSEFVGPGSARDYLTWVARGAELDKWREQLGEYTQHSSRQGSDWQMLTAPAKADASTLSAAEDSRFWEKLKLLVSLVKATTLEDAIDTTPLQEVS